MPQERWQNRGLLRHTTLDLRFSAQVSSSFCCLHLAFSLRVGNVLRWQPVVQCAFFLQSVVSHAWFFLYCPEKLQGLESDRQVTQPCSSLRVLGSTILAWCRHTKVSGVHNENAQTFRSISFVLSVVL